MGVISTPYINVMMTENIDHKRWSKKILSLGRSTLKKLPWCYKKSTENVIYKTVISKTVISKTVLKNTL